MAAIPFFNASSMKKIFLLSLFIVSGAYSFAQPTLQSIEDSVFGWYKLYHLKGAKESYKMDNRVYSIAQLSVCDSLVNGIQDSYIPKAASGMMLKKMLISQL